MSGSLFTPTGDGRWVESVEAPQPMEPARLTLELVRPVPVAPLTVEAEVVRAGRMVQLIEVTVHADETLVSRGRVLRLHRDDQATAGPASRTAIAPPPFPEADSERTSFSGGNADEWVAFHNAGVRHRFAVGALDELGPATDWIALRVPVVPNEEPSPLQRVAAAADFANGISAAVDNRFATFVNPDLTVHLARPAEGEWVGLASNTTVGPHGTALSRTELFDRRGLIGIGAQSLLVQPR